MQLLHASANYDGLCSLTKILTTFADGPENLATIGNCGDISFSTSSKADVDASSESLLMSVYFQRNKNTTQRNNKTAEQ